MNKKLLILGGTGLVGSTLIKYAQKKYQIHITNNKNESDFKDISCTTIDFINESEKIIELIQSLKPDYIIHTVAFPSVDFCETNHDEADFLHVKMTEKISKACKKINSKLIFLSTDAVFNNTKNVKFIESDKPNPINYYAKTKLDAENMVLSFSNDNVVLRTAVVYGWHKKSRFTNWILDSLKNNKKVDPHIDQYSTPTLVDDLVIAILKILENDISGIFHATGKSCVNRFEFATKIAKYFNYDTNLIIPVTSQEKKQLAPRPNASCLDSTKLENLIGFEFKTIDDGLRFIFNQSKLK